MRNPSHSNGDLGTAAIFPTGTLHEAGNPGPRIQPPSVLQACLGLEPEQGQRQRLSHSREAVRHGTAQGSHGAQMASHQRKLQRTAGPAEGRWPDEPLAPKGKKQNIQGPQV